MTMTMSTSKLLFHYPWVICLMFLQQEVGTTHAICPDTCTCATNVVMCQKGNWADIEPKLSSGLHRIILERDVTGLNAITDTTLWKFKDSLKLLKLNDLSLKTIDSNAFAGCKNLIDLDLSDNLLTELSPDLFADLTSLKSLNLASNKLFKLEGVLTPLSNLKTLDISHNSIKDLSTAVFKNLSSLSALKLDGNPLNKLTSQAFSGLHTVQDIQLRDCKILTVEVDVFYNTPKLVSLDLGQNRFSKPITQATITDLSLLRNLLFDHNELKTLQHRDFANLNLQKLDLSFNRITHIDKTAFQNLTVSELDLSDNLILSSKFLHPLSSHLTSLTLVGNPFVTLAEDTFSDFELLKSLNLSSCRLSSLNHKILQGMPALNELDVSYNNLEFLSQETLNIFNSFTFVNLHENKWICDCNIKPLWNWLSKPESSARIQCPPSRSKHQDCNILRCAAPSQLHLKQLHQIQKEQLEAEGECPGDKDSSSLPASTQGAIVAACLGFAIIFLIITVYLWRKGKTSLKLKRVCVPSDAESSHMVDEDSKVPPLSNCDRASLNESDHEFVVRHYFDTLVTDPKLMSRTSDSEEPKSPKERDSMYSSQPSLYNSDPVASTAAFGIESTV